MRKRETAACIVCFLIIAFTIACGILSDLGFTGTAWACGVLGFFCIIGLGPISEFFDS
jgi:hypothetical protein